MKSDPLKSKNKEPEERPALPVDRGRETHDALEPLETYFREAALAQHIPLPRWATW